MRILMHDDVLLTTFDTGMPALKLRFMDSFVSTGLCGLGKGRACDKTGALQVFCSLALSRSNVFGNDLSAVPSWYHYLCLEALYCTTSWSTRTLANHTGT